MLLLLSFLSSFSFAADLPHEDPAFGCFAADEAARYVRDFAVDTQSFGGLELCDSSRDTKKLLNDLFLIEKTEFAPDVDHPFVRGFVDRDQYYTWMRRQTRGVNRGHDIPYATAYNRGGYFTMQDGWAALSTLGRVGTIIHEARHTGGYRHYPCTYGPYANSTVAGCDTSYSQGGSHGVEMEYYARVVLEAKNLHPVYRSMARLMALGRSNFVFNEQPMRKREGMLAVKGGRMMLVDGTNLKEWDLPASGEGRLKRSSYGATVFQASTLKSGAIDLYGPSAKLSDDYSYYKLFKLEKDRLPAAVRDAEELDVGNLRYFTALTEGQLFSYHFPEGKWHAPAVASGIVSLATLLPSGQAGLFGVSADGKIYPFDFQRRRFTDALSERWPAEFSAYAKFGGRVVGLRADGALTEADGQEVPGFAGERFTDLINVPLYDAFEVAP